PFDQRRPADGPGSGHGTAELRYDQVECWAARGVCLAHRLTYINVNHVHPCPGSLPFHVDTRPWTRSSVPSARQVLRVAVILRPLGWLCTLHWRPSHDPEQA